MPDLSDESVAELRALYAAGEIALEPLAGRYGLKRDALRRLAKRLDFPPRRPSSRARSDDDEVAAEPKLEPLDLPAMIARLERAIGREIQRIEAKLEGGQDAERQGRTLASFVRSLNELQRLAAARNLPLAQDDGAEPPRDIDDLRRELARRLAAIEESRRAG